jgi:hypothetical protein
VARRIAERRAQEQARLLAEQARARERAAREARERLAREARERAARQAREQAERLARERAAREALDRSAREARERAAREARERAQREAQERARQQQATQQRLAQQIRQRRPPQAGGVAEELAPWLEQELEFSRLAEKTGDAKVQQFIDEALKNARGKTEAERLENAWLFLKGRRDTYNEQSDELAAAEQYLFARAKVAGHHAWFPYLRFAVPAYQTYKTLFYSLGLEGYLWKASAEGHVPSMPSDMQHRWGLQGALDGMGDQRVKLQRIIDEQYRKAGAQPRRR